MLEETEILVEAFPVFEWLVGSDCSPKPVSLQGQRPFFAPQMQQVRPRWQQVQQQQMRPSGMQGVPGVGQVPRARGQRQLPSRGVAPSQAGGAGQQRDPQVQQSQQGRMPPAGMQGGQRFKYHQGVRNQPGQAGSMGMPPHDQQALGVSVIEATIQAYKPSAHS